MRMLIVFEAADGEAEPAVYMTPVHTIDVVSQGPVPGSRRPILRGRPEEGADKAVQATIVVAVAARKSVKPTAVTPIYIAIPIGGY